MLDRTLQRTILELLLEKYPDGLGVRKIPGYQDRQRFLFNLYYLYEQGFIKAIYEKHRELEVTNFRNEHQTVKITAKGVDFLSDDGGITTLLENPRVCFDNEDFKHFLQYIDNPTVSDERHTNLVATLGTLRHDELKALYTSLISQGFADVEKLEGLLTLE